jgi:arylsulfatase A-like enzyme
MTLSLINPHDICKVLGGKVQGATFMDAIFFCRDESEPYLRYNDRASLPSNYNLPYIKGMINDEDYMYKELEDRNENEWRRYISTYNLLIEKTDWYIELVLDALKKNGLEEDTIVVFTTDHGDLMGSHKLIAKTAFYEESAKTFMLLRYPKKIKHAINNEAKISTIDLMPTLLELCNIKAPNDVDGKSFKEALYNKNENFSIVVSENPFGKMVRYQSLKYIKSIVNDEEYEILIDLEKDPEESTNCIEDSVYQSDVVFLRTYLDNYLKEKGITLNYK